MKNGVSGGQGGALAMATVLVASVAASAWYYSQPGTPPAVPIADAREMLDTPAKVRNFCGNCHNYPPPDAFPRSAWKDEVERGYRFFAASNLKLLPPPIEEVIDYYESRAPEKLPQASIQYAAAPPPVKFSAHSFPDPPDASPPAVSHVNLVHLFDDRRLDIVACEMRHGLIMSLSPYEKDPAWRVLAKLKNPSHAEVVDFDGDGVRDILVADLGSFPPTELWVGSVVWLKGSPDGSFAPFTLLEDVGRTADVQAADFNGDGKLDLVVAVFGWRQTGEILVLENTTTDWSQPQFTTHRVDPRSGTIHVPAIDLNADGKPDFVALVAQEHEQVCAFINQGDFKFVVEVLYTAPQPAYGSSGIQLVDLDGDSHVDVLYSNGDVLDSPELLKPYHGVQWLRNKGGERLEFEHRPMGAMYGVHRAVAGDVTGDGRLDVVAVSYLPKEQAPQHEEQELDAIVVFEQTAPGEFVRHRLASRTCDHVTCALGDVFGTGKLDIVTATFTASEAKPTLHVLENQGPIAEAH